ncbi:MAG: hypothetical protein EPO08_08415 [Rhodospirillaceae bacterium]|nr:MAG: hypothetical protein EPO08_08415 [Rhodospirillaceae bacterium]
MAAAPDKTSPTKANGIDDRDTLHTVRLADMPVEHPTLKRARIVKNSRLISVIELFRDRETGSGQVEVSKIPQQFSIPMGHPDMRILYVLAEMPSYDVYSLRIALRQAGIQVNNQEALKLSPAKVQELSAFMKNFTRPLLMQVYGDEGVKMETFDDVIHLFRDPDVQKARHKLTLLASKLGIEITAIPIFLEDYADIFMSLSYYRQCLERVTPSVHEFFLALDDLRKNLQMRNNPTFLAAAKDIQKTFTDVLTTVTGRLESFDKRTKDMWENLSAEQFRKIEATIKTFHQMMGGILCALTVKMDAWVELFPNRSVGGPGRRSEFILNDMRAGMQRVREIAASGPPT